MNSRPRWTDADLIDTAIRAVLYLVRDFESAIAQACCPNRVLQIRKRIGVCVELLQQVETDSHARC